VEQSAEIPFAGAATSGQFYVWLAVILAATVGAHLLAHRRFGEPALHRWTRIVEGTIFSIIVGSMLLLSALQVVLRNVFHSGVLWFDPLVRILILWLAFFGAAAATSQARHLHIDVVQRVLPPDSARRLRRALSLMAALVCAFLANGSRIYLQQEAQHAGIPFLGVPSWAAQSILLWGFALLTYRFLIQTIWPAVTASHEPAAAPSPESLDQAGRAAR